MTGSFQQHLTTGLGELPEKYERPHPPHHHHHHSLQPQPDGFCTETLSPALLESFKIQYLQFLAYTKTPQYKASLQQLLDQEKVRGACFCVPSTLQRG